MPLPPNALKTATSVFLASITLSLTPVVAHADLSTEPSAPSPLSALSIPEGEQRYIVKYENGVNAEAESASLEEQGVEVKNTLSHAMKASVVVATPDQIRSIGNSEEVTSIELDSRVKVNSATSLWGLDRIDQRTGRDGQYVMGNEGAGVDIYVVDTGLNYSHADFSGRVPDQWWGIHDGRAANDCNGHGTHVAGTAAGTTSGVAKKANIIPIRALECNGSGWSSTVMAGIDWAIARHVPGQPAVLNLSIGGFTNWSFDQTVQNAVNDGITVIAAAGNDGQDACAASPARVPSAITVAATNMNDTQVSWSNHGSCVDIQAPGAGIRSAWIGGIHYYATLDGTSMATPHVAGAAAILLSRDRGMTPAQVTQSMIDNSTKDVINGIRGATPNRMLFVPFPRQGQPSCANIQLGQAWAGIGTHCGLQGSGAAAATPEAAVTAPVSAAPAEAPKEVEEPAPAPAPKDDAPVTAPKEEAPATATEPEAPAAPSTNADVVTAPAPAPAPAIAEEAPKQAPSSPVQQLQASAARADVSGNDVPEKDSALIQEQKQAEAAPAPENKGVEAAGTEQAPAAPATDAVAPVAEATTVNPEESPKLSHEAAVAPAAEDSNYSEWFIGGGVALVLASAPFISGPIRRSLKGPKA